MFPDINCFEATSFIILDDMFEEIHLRYSISAFSLLPQVLIAQML